MQLLIYSIRYSVLPTNSSLLNITLYFLVINNTSLQLHKILAPFEDVITEFDCIFICYVYLFSTHSSVQLNYYFII
jgi:hypothetical protein